MFSWLIVLTIFSMPLTLQDIADTFNRRLQQVEMLYSFCGEDINRLWELEVRIQRLFIFYCPSSKEEADRILCY